VALSTDETNIGTDWLLRLDADYQVSDPLIAEPARLDSTAVRAYRVRFNYAVFFASFFHRFSVKNSPSAEGVFLPCGTRGTPMVGTCMARRDCETLPSFMTIGGRPVSA
jgi:hypothetical protein